MCTKGGLITVSAVMQPGEVSNFTPKKSIMVSTGLNGSDALAKYLLHGYFELLCGHTGWDRSQPCGGSRHPPGNYIGVGI